MKDRKTIGLVGKYVALQDAYLSVAESLRHGGIPNDAKVNILWINSEEITHENASEMLSMCDGIIVPGGFGDRGIEGMIEAIRYDSCRFSYYRLRYRYYGRTERYH